MIIDERRIDTTRRFVPASEDGMGVRKLNRWLKPRESSAACRIWWMGRAAVLESALSGGLSSSGRLYPVGAERPEFQGVVQYYLLAQDVFRLGRLRWVMETSMLKTLAGKSRSTVTKTARKYKRLIETPDGPRTCFQVMVERDRGRKPLVARLGGIPLKQQRTATLTVLNPSWPAADAMS
ncbi:group II intron reverse transcriptase/maturase [Streptomyces sp. Inha503]|uniref:group II intron reverse transcriptase/maturase n=1 Tax=Streptomyces sp. Inha503 TaxID=3383314 RepID=UPI0039A3F5F8